MSEGEMVSWSCPVACSRLTQVIGGDIYYAATLNYTYGIQVIFFYRHKILNIAPIVTLYVCTIAF